MIKQHYVCIVTHTSCASPCWARWLWDASSMADLRLAKLWHEQHWGAAPHLLLGCAAHPREHLGLGHEVGLRQDQVHLGAEQVG